jgi:hypothetical protein
MGAGDRPEAPASREIQLPDLHHRYDAWERRLAAGLESHAPSGPGEITGHHPPVSGSTPHDLGSGPDRGRPGAEAGRRAAGVQRRAVPGRTAGVPPHVLEVLPPPLEEGVMTIFRV